MTRSASRTCLLAGVLLAAASMPIAATGGGAAPHDPGDSRALVVTSDTSVYCRRLSAAVEAHGKLPVEVSELKAEGDGMCEQGQVRGGIARLRRALLVLHGSAAGGSGQTLSDPP